MDIIHCKSEVTIKNKKTGKVYKDEDEAKKTFKMQPLTQTKVTYKGMLTLSSLSYHWMEKQIDTIRWN